MSSLHNQLCCTHLRETGLKGALAQVSLGSSNNPLLIVVDEERELLQVVETVRGLLGAVRRKRRLQAVIRLQSRLASRDKRWDRRGGRVGGAAVLQCYTKLGPAANVVTRCSGDHRPEPATFSAMTTKGYVPHQ